MSKQKSLSSEVKQFVKEQLTEWTLANTNYDALNRVQVKELDLGCCKVRVQFNQERMRSTAAKVDKKTIQERKCFLCQANLPPEQRGIPYKGKYIILVNPFPIFPVHLTIPDLSHTDQLIYDRFADMLDLSKDLDEFVVFYNGPKCGASAPDHMHFQAGNKGFLPLEEDIKNIEQIPMYSDENVKIYGLKDYQRNLIVIESESKERVIDEFSRIYSDLEIPEGEPEPMLNLVSWYEEGVYYACLFPRKQHRPSCFYAEGEKNLMLSPASVDISGVCVLPQEKDFLKITAEDVIEVFNEI